MAESIAVDLLWSLATAWAVMSLAFWYGHRKKRYDIVDTAWGLAFIAIALSLLLRHGIGTTSTILLLGMVIAWGLRLALHTFQRFSRTANEDPRYVELRKKWPTQRQGLRIYVRIYLVQALLATVVALPIISILGGSISPITSYAALGIAVWLCGFIIEIMADLQLRIFLSIPENRSHIMKDGLWAYSRHPNYFGEVVLWWGIGLMAYGTSHMYLALIGPLVITLLILFVSGIPPAEARMSKKAGWKEYAKKTNALLPWPPDER